MPEPAVKSLFSGGSRGMKPGHVILFFLPEKTITAKLKIFNKFGGRGRQKKGPAMPAPFF